MRQLSSHKLAGLNDAIEIYVLDEPGAGGANHRYQISTPNSRTACEISFQNGPIKEAGVNGISNESLLAVVIDRLKCFQSDKYACRENALALTKMEEAMHWLHHRTRERLARGVEGTMAE